MWAGIILFIVLIVTILTIFKGDYLAYVDATGTCPIWTRSGQSMLGPLLWVYLAVVAICWLTLVHYHGYKDISLYITAAFIIFSAFWARRISTGKTFGAVWTYLLLGIGLLVWVGGMFTELNCSKV